MANRKGGKHWRTTHAAKVRARESAFFAAKEALGRNTMVSAAQLPVSITWVAPNRIRRDLDGLLSAEKPRLDGIAAALGIDDSLFRPVTLDAALPWHERMVVIAEYPQKNAKFGNLDAKARIKTARAWIVSTTGVALTENEYKLYLGLFRSRVERRFA